MTAGNAPADSPPLSPSGPSASPDIEPFATARPKPAFGTSTDADARSLERLLPPWRPTFTGQ